MYSFCLQPILPAPPAQVGTALPQTYLISTSRVYGSMICVFFFHILCNLITFTVYDFLQVLEPPVGSCVLDSRIYPSCYCIQSLRYPSSSRLHCSHIYCHCHLRLDRREVGFSFFGDIRLLPAIRRLVALEILAALTLQPIAPSWLALATWPSKYSPVSPPPLERHRVAEHSLSILLQRSLYTLDLQQSQLFPMCLNRGNLASIAAGMNDESVGPRFPLI